MKIILAPDKFKGTLTAVQAAAIEAEAIREILPEAEIIQVPLADGGEGTVETLTTALHGSFHRISVCGPLGLPVQAVFGIGGKTAVMEMSSASGMALLEQRELNPMRTSTFGTGELIRAGLDAGVEEMIIGIGGSATVDGGCGMAEALGVRFYDSSGKLLTGLCGGLLGRIARIDISGLDSRIPKTKIRIASDVTNPLLGKNGSAAVFGPQKGATPEMIPVLESGLANLRKVVFDQKIMTEDRPGDGAAGGLGFGLRSFCGAEPESGAQLAIRITELEKYLDNADFLITGEGRTDSQTENGKLCLEVAKLCRKKNVRAILLSGLAEGNPCDLFDQVYSTVRDKSFSFENIRKNAAFNLRAATLQVADFLSDQFQKSEKD